MPFLIKDQYSPARNNFVISSVGVKLKEELYSALGYFRVVEIE
jgi:hypothetical protein